MYYIYFINEIKLSNFFKKQSKCLKCSSISEQNITNLRIKFFVAIVSYSLSLNSRPLFYLHFIKFTHWNHIPLIDPTERHLVRCCGAYDADDIRWQQGL